MILAKVFSLLLNVVGGCGREGASGPSCTPVVLDCVNEFDKVCDYKLLFFKEVADCPCLHFFNQDFLCL